MLVEHGRRIDIIISQTAAVLQGAPDTQLMRQVVFWQCKCKVALTRLLSRHDHLIPFIILPRIGLILWQQLQVFDDDRAAQPQRRQQSRQLEPDLLTEQAAGRLSNT